MSTSITPVTLVTGFLGAGKTTLLKHLLENRSGQRLGVIVNDFGSINIDAELIREVQGETQTMRLTNGCICCSIRGDLLETVVQLAAQPDAPEQIVIEASGVSDPQQLAQTFTLPELAHITRLDAVVTVVDALEFDALRGESARLAHRQIAATDLVVLNKIDAAAEAALATLRATIDDIAPGVRVLQTRYCKVPVSAVLEGGEPDGGENRATRRRRSAADALDCGDHDHGSMYEAFSWEHGEPLDVQKLRDALAKLPSAVLRAKGYVYVAQAPEERALLHTVGRRSSLTRTGPWPGEPRTRLVFIGAAAPDTRVAVYSLLESAIALDFVARQSKGERNQ